MLRPINIAVVMLTAINTIALPVAVAQPLDLPLATQAYSVAENWVARGQTPEQTVAVEAEDVAGVYVTIRLEGVTLGQAAAAVDKPMQLLAEKKPRNFMPLLRQATSAAIADARQSLVTLGARPGGEAVPQRYSDIAPLLQLDVQFARPPVPLILDQPSDLTRKMTVGVHGLAMVVNDKWSWVFPGTAIAANLSLPDQLNRLLREHGLDMTQLAAVSQQRGLMRFDAMHLNRSKADGPVTRLYRGQTVLPAGPLTDRSIAAVARMWAEHLILQQQADGGFAGTYHPTSNRFDPQRATIADSMLAAYALARYSRSGALGEDDAKRYAGAARRAVAAAIDVLGANPDKGPKTRADDDEAGADRGLPAISCQHAAMTLLALIETPDTADMKAARDRLAGALLACTGENGAFRTMPDARARAVSRPTQALATLALVRMYAQTRQPVYLDAAKKADAALWSDAQTLRVASVLPWAAHTEFELLQLGQATPALITVRDRLEALWQAQIQPQDLNDSEAKVSPDSVGGFQLDTEIVPEPTWLTAGPLAAAAAGLTIDKFVTKADRPAWLLNNAVGLRFLYQLTMTPHAAWYVHDLPASIGGVRTAFWDNRQPLAATAMALLAAAEFQHALAKFNSNP